MFELKGVRLRENQTDRESWLSEKHLIESLVSHIRNRNKGDHHHH